MPYSEQLAGRIRDLLGGDRSIVEKAMFGRRMFKTGGRLAVGVSGDELMVRVGPEGKREAVSQPHARPCVMSGRPMQDWVLVGPAGFETDGQLDAWLQRGLDFARSQVQA